MRPAPPPPLSFTHTATTRIYTLSLHDALPIWRTVDAQESDRRICRSQRRRRFGRQLRDQRHYRPDDGRDRGRRRRDRKSTRLNSSHQIISYAVFCLKKKKIQTSLALHTTGVAI